MQTVKFYTNKNATWQNAAGDAVPVKFVPAVDKRREALAQKIYKQALNAEGVLVELYAVMNTAFDEIKSLVKQEYEIKNGKEKKQGKGSLTWYNFDKSLKVEADINEVVKWDEALLSEALRLLNEYLGSNLTDANELIKGLVSEAFANSRGMIDSRKIFQLLKYKEKIKAAKFQKACELLTQAQGIDKTKLYMRVWVKEADGSYRNVNLNFSSI